MLYSVIVWNRTTKCLFTWMHLIWLDSFTHTTGLGMTFLFIICKALFTKAWCTRSIKMTIQKKYQKMQPCHYSECSDIHNPFSDHYPRQSVFGPFRYIRSLKMTKKLCKYLRCYHVPFKWQTFNKNSKRFEFLLTMQFYWHKGSFSWSAFILMTSLCVHGHYYWPCVDKWSFIMTVYTRL